jgi:hypothetical protein
MKVKLAKNQFSETASWLSTQGRRKTNLIYEGIVSRDGYVFDVNKTLIHLFLNVR